MRAGTASALSIEMKEQPAIDLLPQVAEANTPQPGDVAGG
jgi:hypothetical protein